MALGPAKVAEIIAAANAKRQRIAEGREVATKAPFVDPFLAIEAAERDRLWSENFMASFGGPEAMEAQFEKDLETATVYKTIDEYMQSFAKKD